MARATPTPTGEADEQLRLASGPGRWVLLATVLGSGLAMLDATIVNVALRRIGEDLDAGLSGLQWIVNGYTLTLAALILLGGSLGDRFGRRRVFVFGVVWFAVASVLCGVAPNTPSLVAARMLQGVGGALLTPGSLAIISASFAKSDRPAAIGAWSGLGGIAVAVGPFLGGYLVGVADWGWRLAFLINVPMAALVVMVALRHVPESHDPTVSGRLDYAGGALGAIGLAGITFGLTRGGEAGFGAEALGAIAVGVAAFVAFVVAERRERHPMLPLGIFSSRQFTAANLVTLVIYGAFGTALFLLALQLQTVVGYTPLQAGTALLPVTVVMLLLSARGGRLAQRIGPRLPMALGPIVVGAGLALVGVSAGAGASYASDILPGVVTFALGLSLTVAPLTATVLAAADPRHAGVASGVNNAVARAAGLLGVAVIPVVAGLSGDVYGDPAAFGAGFRTGMLIAAALCVAGGVLAWATIRNDVLDTDDEQVEGEPARDHAVTDTHCPVTGPPLRSPERAAAS